jgi:tRNA nucleotidyltransferase (CCA-adding enzyme)
MLRRASMQDLSAQLADVARAIADVLGRAGHRAWIVGGAPRDLCLARAPKEIDMSSDAHPEQVERLFAHTIPVGRAFGTLVIHQAGIDVQHTTFRSEAGYSDARRPDAVVFGASAREDSTRRDFTCNALYLDPLSDEFLDPQQGLEDLARRRLACVGDARRRFEEDGLRLLRMARFAAALELELADGMLDAARSARETLRGVSPERVLGELRVIFEGPHSDRALDLLESAGLLERAVPGLAPGAGAGSAAWARTRRVFAAFTDPPGLALGLAALLAPDRVAAIEALRASRAVQARVREIRALEAAMSAMSSRGAGLRSQRIRWMRSAAFDEALALARAHASADGVDARRLVELALERGRLGESDLHPERWITSRDIEAAGVARGPSWSRLLEEAERLQLDRQVGSRDEALAWLRERVQSDSATGHDGGNTPRRK